MIPDINQRQSYSSSMSLNFRFCHSNLIPPIDISGSAMVVLNLIITDCKHPTYNVYSLNYCTFTFKPNRRFTLYVLIFPVQGYEEESFSNHSDQRVDFLNERNAWFGTLEPRDQLSLMYDLRFEKQIFLLKVYDCLIQNKRLVDLYDSWK